jgi:hypothetical protein
MMQAVPVRFGAPDLTGTASRLLASGPCLHRAYEDVADL